MPFSMDGLPIVGDLSSLGFPRVWIAGGFGPHGIMEGPGAMSYLADVIAESLLDTTSAATTSSTSNKKSTLAELDPSRIGGVTLS